MTTLRICILILVASLVLLTAGCAHYDPEQIAYPYAVNVTFSNCDFYSHAYWVGISDAGGRQPICVKQITANGKVRVADSVDARVSVTILEASYSHGVNAISYLNAARGDWYYSEGPDTGALGGARLTMTYPSGQTFDRMVLAWPGMHQDSTGAMADSMCSYANTVFGVARDFKFSAFAQMCGPNGNYCGWILDQPYDVDAGGLHNFTLPITQPVTLRNVYTNRVLSELELHAYRGPAFTNFTLFATEGIGQTFAMTEAQFPATVRALTGDAWFTAGYHYKIWQKVDALPDSLTIPESYVTADYNALTHEFRNITTHGDVDALRAFWYGESQGHPFQWQVLSADSSTISYPAIPDSILRQTGFSTSVLQGWRLTMEDYDPVVGYDEFLQTESRQSGPVESRITRRYSYSLDFGL